MESNKRIADRELRDSDQALPSARHCLNSAYNSLEDNKFSLIAAGVGFGILSITTYGLAAPVGAVVIINLV
jgi:hypothetical protein